MKILYVYAHPEPESLSGQLKRRALEVLQSAGHGVVLSDLHAMNFTAVHGRSDFDSMRESDVFRYGSEQSHATRERGFAPDIQAEIDKLYACELLILQFPLWWFSVPAILKGWIDRVFAYGALYDHDNRYGTGRLKGRRALCAITMGAREYDFEPDGVHGDLWTNLWPIHNGCLHYLGFDVLPPFIAYGTGNLSDAERAGAVDAYAAYLGNLEALEPLFFHPSEDFGPDERLKPGVVGRTPAHRNLR
ncbi:MAG: NAD(P)H-dependent oxidoreductase [Proteobacteria bacterium]|nr:NAD(P)H-dependent oxidoreductase [Pseudomonadota bacterium]